jgi:hypothetical protein
MNARNFPFEQQAKNAEKVAHRVDLYVGKFGEELHETIGPNSDEIDWITMYRVQKRDRPDEDSAGLEQSVGFGDAAFRGRDVLEGFGKNYAVGDSIVKTGFTDVGDDVGFYTGIEIYDDSLFNSVGWRAEIPAVIRVFASEVDDDAPHQVGVLGQ